MNQFVGFMPHPKPVGDQIKSEAKNMPLLLLNKEQIAHTRPVVKDLPEKAVLDEIFAAITNRLAARRTGG